MILCRIGFFWKMIILYFLSRSASAGSVLFSHTMQRKLVHNWSDFCKINYSLPRLFLLASHNQTFSFSSSDPLIKIGQISLICAFNCSLIFFLVLYTVYNSAMASCILISGIGIWTSHIVSQSNVSRAEPQELKRAYLSNSVLEKKTNKNSGKRLSQSVLKTVEIEETKYVSHEVFNAMDILSPRRDVSGINAISRGATSL